jgi:hypothetical protein
VKFFVYVFCFNFVYELVVIHGVILDITGSRLCLLQCWYLPLVALARHTLPSQN